MTFIKHLQPEKVYKMSIAATTSLTKTSTWRQKKKQLLCLFAGNTNIYCSLSGQHQRMLNIVCKEKRRCQQFVFVNYSNQSLITYQNKVLIEINTYIVRGAICSSVTFME